MLPVWKAMRALRPHILYLAYPLIARYYPTLRGKLESADCRYHLAGRHRLSRYADHLGWVLCCLNFEAYLIRKHVYAVNRALAVPPYRTASVLSVRYWACPYRDPSFGVSVVYDYLIDQQDTYKRLHPGSLDGVGVYYYNPKLRRTVL